MSDPPRRGWRERREPGLYRAHRVRCLSSADRQPGRRCGCAWEVAAPGARPGVTRIVTVTGTVGEARAERRRLLAGGRVEPAPRPGADTLNDFAASYFRAKAPVLAGATIRNREADYVRRIAPSLGDLPLTAVTRQRVEVWLGELVGAASSHRMIVQTVATLRVILATALEWERLAVNPAARLRLPRPPVEDEAAVDRVLDQGQLGALVRAAGTLRVETMLRAAGEGGLRKGEVIGLRWIDLDPEARLIHVRRAVWQERAEPGSTPRRVEKVTKGGRARRVGISARFADRLGAWRLEAALAGADVVGGYVWPGRGGVAMNERSPNQALERTLRRARLVDGGGRPLVTFHGLRHTAASIMFSHGVPDIDVSRQLGHANLHITGVIYSRTRRDSHLARAAAPFEALEGAQTLGEMLGGTSHTG